VTVDGRRVTEVEMKPDEPGPPTVARIGRLSLLVLLRAGRYAIRLKDPEHKLRQEFRGLRWFPPNESYRVTARFVRYDRPKAIPITNILGQTEPQPSPGYVVFELAGREWRLEPIQSDPKELFFIFRDTTSREETYQAGRFLYADAPQGDRVVLDFNKAYNPPCAFNPYTTCQLPPRQNRLPIPIRAGEKRYAGE
jgi:uncharacterized protein (DUF1684 family)